jgi:hypothetical protein
VPDKLYKCLIQLVAFTMHTTILTRCRCFCVKVATFELCLPARETLDIRGQVRSSEFVQVCV